MYSVSDYIFLLKQLFPRGAAWAMEGLQKKLCEAMAKEPARLDGRAEQLITELFPFSTNELILDWENLTGLPDGCIGRGETLQQRRQLILQKINQPASMRPVDYIEIAAGFGYVITIEQYDSFRVDHSYVDEPINDESWRYAWTVRSSQVPLIEFRIDESGVDERLGTFGNEILECLINRLKPAHTVVNFVYGA